MQVLEPMRQVFSSEPNAVRLFDARVHTIFFECSFAYSFRKSTQLFSKSSANEFSNCTMKYVNTFSAKQKDAQNESERERDRERQFIERQYIVKSLSQLAQNKSNTSHGCNFCTCLCISWSMSVKSRRLSLSHVSLFVTMLIFMCNSEYVLMKKKNQKVNQTKRGCCS